MIANTLFNALFEVSTRINMQTSPPATNTADRYNAKWYNKRIKQNAKIKHKLIDTIQKYKEEDFPWTEQDLMYLNYEDLLEIAGACINKALTITVKEGEDYNDGSDSKMVISQNRNNNKLNPKTGKSDWKNSYKITGTNGKNGAIRSLLYNTITEDFEYVYVPWGSYDNDTSSNSIEIILESYSLTPGVVPTFTGKHESYCKWNKFIVPSIEDMFLADH